VADMGVAKEILQTLLQYPRQTPSSLELSLGVSISTVKAALVHLADLGLIEPIARGLYKITELGEYVLHSCSDVVNTQVDRLNTESAKE